MTQPWTTIRQVVAVDGAKAVLVGGSKTPIAGDVSPGMYHVLHSNGKEEFINNPKDL